MLDKIIRKIDDIINLIAISFFIIFLLFGLYAFFDAFKVYDSAKISSEIIKLKPPEVEDNKVREFSLEPLIAINPDICGWICINDTNIDYPVVIGKDNSEYLNRNYKKEYATSGSIFLDYKNQRNFEDSYSIIYGHNMKSSLMFSDIKKFEDPEFFNQHEYGTLYTETGIYKMEIFCIARVNAFSNDVYDLNIYKSGRTLDVVQIFNKNSSFKRQLEFTPEDKIVLLSTCSSSGSNDRLVLVSRLIKYNEEDIIIKEKPETILDRLEKQEDLNKHPTFLKQDVEQKVKTKKEFKINISARTLSLRILIIIVIIIFTVAIAQNVVRVYHKWKSKK